MGHSVLSAVRPVGFIATISTGVQGVVWACFYLAALLTHYCVLKPDYDRTTLSFSSYLAAYLQGTRCTPTNLFCVNLIGPEQVAIWLVLAIVFNLLLFTASIILFVVLIKSTKEIYYVFINTWIGTGCATLIIDVIISVVFVIDLTKLWESNCTNDMGLSSLLISALFIFPLRGVFICAANVCFIIFFIMASYNLRRKIIKNSEMDLTSNWPSTSDSSYDFAPTNGDRDDLIGVVNPIQEPAYPEYSAKGRWPTLNQRNFTTSQNQYTNTTNFNDFPPPRLVRGDYHMTNNDVYDLSNIATNNRLQSRQQEESNFNQDALLKILSEESKAKSVASRGQKVQEKLQDNSYEVPIQTDSRNNTIDRNRKYSRNNNRYDSRTVPSRLSGVPVPPPLPPLRSFTNNNNNNNNNLNNNNNNNNNSETSLKLRKPKPIDPDYTPPTERKMFDINSPFPAKQEAEHFTFDTKPKVLPTVEEQRAKFQMSLHEAIKTRPPLRPVLQRMTGVTEC